MKETVERWGTENLIKNKELDLSLTYWTNIEVTIFWLFGILTGIILGINIGMLV